MTAAAAFDGTTSGPHTETASAAPSIPKVSSAHAPVGIFDSGLGGLSVLRAVRAQLPGESIVYVADSLYAPYGERDDDFIADRTLAIGQWLVEQGAKVLVVACNTATAQSIALVRERLPIPLIGVEPGVKPAALQSKTRVAGVLATQVTLRSARFQDLLQRYAADCRFLCQPGHGLVQAVERCDVGSAELRALLQNYLQPMLDAGADTLVLGCTHYPFLDAAIRDIVGDRLTLIDTSVAIARQLERVLDQQGLRTASGTGPALAPRFFSTSDGTHLQQLAETLLDLAAPVERVHIPSRRTAAPDPQAV
ncbi:Glutamate racemase [Paraburkholderia saeva]|uniref:Glutamate racemase n=1 Tax=Paraburkholderia saeva TaxID=2777537 RepID=A0A9N8RXB2_9BURK|nr:glutamate racemase [Paraburkholderia saeva]CAG4900347.1 Glutamate racemase [Paraburkholderia saeva]CAG4923948.1 Glutamate racemase [Paraburkholderia saeva]